MAISIAAIYRYPVKGLSAEPLERVPLTPGQSLPHDRRFAIAPAATRFDPERPEWLPKTSFLMLMRDETLARLHTRFDERSGRLTIDREGQRLLAAPITESAGRLAVGKFFGEFLGESLGGAPRVIEAPGHTFADARRKPNASTSQYVSLVNLASVRALEEVAGAAVDPLRFRANLYVDGAPAWTELGWVGAEIVAGDARLHVVSAITRCAATTVNPATAERDLDIPAILRREFGHVHMGVYAEVVGGGEVRGGDGVAPA
jgi:MOSC domain-containing protein